MYYLQSRYYDPEVGRFLNADAYTSTGQGILSCNMFAYCANNPVNAIDPTGESFFLLAGLIGAALGAVIGGSIAASQGQDVLAGAVAGATIVGAVGLAVGAAAGVMLAGSATASISSVCIGANSVAAISGSCGIGAGIMMIGDNITQAVAHSPQVFWSGIESVETAAYEFANSINGITLSMTRLGQYLAQTNASNEMWEVASRNFANVASTAASAIYCVQSSAGISISGMWAQIEYPLLQLKDIVYAVVG